MKNIVLIVGMLLTGLMAFACPTCEIAQPRYLKGITHGTGPQSNWDFLIISLTAVIVITTLFFSIKWLVKPGERSATHIKSLVLNME
jgi:hypothetical protein